MRKAICVKCGREVTIGSFCDDCFLSKNELFSIKDFDVVVCDCGSWYDAGWRQKEVFEKMLQEIIERKIKTKNRIKKINLSIKHKTGNNFRISITACGNIFPSKKQKEETNEIGVRIKNRKCDDCIRLSGRYHEAVFQVRGDVNAIMKKLHEFLPKSSWIEHKKEGPNIFFINKGDASRIARHLKTVYDIKESFKFVGMKKGKRLIRDFYSIRG